jgi:hypothetical protein
MEKNRIRDKHPGSAALGKINKESENGKHVKVRGKF